MNYVQNIECMCYTRIKTLKLIEEDRIVNWNNRWRIIQIEDFYNTKEYAREAEYPEEEVRLDKEQVRP